MLFGYFTKNLLAGSRELQRAGRQPQCHLARVRTGQNGHPPDRRQQLVDAYCESAVIILRHDLLVKMDFATMAHGLEARSPLLDRELIDTVSRFPEEIKLRGFQTKPLLRALARRHLPDPIPRAPKRGFEVPLLRWLRTDLRSLCEDVMLARDGLLAEMFDRAALERLLREKDDLDPARWSRRVWLLLMLGMWDRCVRKTQASTAAAAGTAIP